MNSNNIKAPIITSRLIIRELKNTDAEALFKLRSDQVVNKYLDRKAPESIDAIHSFIQKILGNDQNVYRVIELKDNRRLAGTICLWNYSNEKNEAEIGFELLSEFHGQGLMREAANEIISCGFNTLGLSAITGWTTPDNKSSIRLLERCGFEYAGNDGNMVIYRLQGRIK